MSIICVIFYHIVKWLNSVTKNCVIKMILVLISPLFYRSIFVPECNSQPAALSQQPHSLLQLHTPPPFCWSKHWSYPGADNTSPAGTSHCEQASPLGLAHYFHWAHQEPILQVLEPWVCQVCSRNWKVSIHMILTQDKSFCHLPCVF